MGANINNQKQGKTALHLAISNHQDDIALILVHNGANLFLRDWDGDSSFQKAVQNNRILLIPSMLEQLTNNPIYRLHLINEYENAIVSAYFQNYKELFAMLVKRILITNRNPNLLTISLLGAAANGWNDQIILLLENGANVNGIDRNGSTALHEASSQNRTEIVALLLNRGANVNVRDTNRLTPLILATRKGFGPIVSLLLDYKADTSLVDLWGKTAVDYANPSIRKIFDQYIGQ